MIFRIAVVIVMLAPISDFIVSYLGCDFENYPGIGCDVMELSFIVGSVESQFTAAKWVYKLISNQALAQNS